VLSVLLSEVQCLNQIAIALDIVVTEIVEQPSSLPDEHEKPAPGVMVLLVNLEMLGEVVDPLGEYGYLDIGRPGILLMPLKLFDDLLLFLYMQHHFFYPPGIGTSSLFLVFSETTHSCL
jgi:hypothetical protein